MKRRPRIFIWILSIFILFLPGIRHTEAHGYIVRSTPKDRSVLLRAPNQVQIWFSEGLEPRFSTIEVFNQQGEQVDSGDGGVDERNSARLTVSLPSDLPPGAYLVKLRPVFTSDGHAVSDTLVFWIGEQIGNIETVQSADTAVPLEAIWRVVLTLSLTVLFGTILMYALILRPGWGNSAIKLGGLPPRVMQRLSRLLWTSLILAIITNVLALLQISMRLFETGLAAVLKDELWNIVLVGTSFGDVWQFRMVLLIAMLFIQIIAAQQARNRPGSTHILWLVNGFLAGATIGTISLISHASGSPLWGLLSVVVDYIHLLAVSAWIGGLIVMALIIRPALQPLEAAARGQALQAVIRRFSALAVIAVSVIIVTGIYSTVAFIPKVSDIPGTTYGLTLLSKWILILPLLGLGAIHFVIVSPERMQRFAEFLQAHARFAKLPETLRLEMLFALAVIFAAGWLPATPPPIPDNARGDVAAESKTLFIREYAIELTVNPGASGANSYDVLVKRDNEPAKLNSAKIRFSHPDSGRYTTPLALDSTEPGLWAGADGEIDRSGNWIAIIDLDNGIDPPLRAALEWNMIEEVKDQNSRSPGIFNWLSLIAILIVATIWTAPLLYRHSRQLNWTPANMAIGVMAIGFTTGIAVAGGIIFANTGQRLQEQYDSPPEIVNPVFPDEESISAGREIFAGHCWQCHGESGRGYTPLAVNLNRPVPDLTQTLFQRDDSDVYRILERGIGTRHFMANDLIAGERWNLVNYLRSLQ